MNDANASTEKKKPGTLADAFEAIFAWEAPLAERLSAYAGFMSDLNPLIADAYENLIYRLRAGEAGRNAPAIGESLPPFLLPASNGKLVALEDLTAVGPVVLNFNRGHWCPFCRIHLQGLSRHFYEFQKAGAELVSIVPDRQQFLRRLRLETNDRIRVLTDIDNGYSLSIGLVMALDERIQSLMRERGIRLDVFQGNDGWFVPLPATFVVDRKGIIAARHVDPDFRNRMTIEAILAALAGLNTP